MPTPTSYVYSSIVATIPAGAVSLARLRREIELSAIVTQIDFAAGGLTAPGDDTLTIWFKDPLSSGDKTILDGSASQTPNTPATAGSILGDHSGLPLPDDPVAVNVTSGTVALSGGSVEVSGGALDSGIKDEIHGTLAAFTANSALKVADDVILAGLRFSDEGLAEHWDLLRSGNSRLETVVRGIGTTMYSGTGIGSVSLTTKTTYEAQIGRGRLVRIAVATLDAGVAGNIREWGLADSRNGFLICLNGTTLTFVVRNAGVDTGIVSTAWDVPVTHDGFAHIWDIQIKWPGLGDVYLFRDGVLVHTVRQVGVSSQYLTQTIDLPFVLRNANITNTSDVALRVVGVQIAVEGGQLLQGLTSSGKPRGVQVNDHGSVATVLVGPRKGHPVYVSTDGSPSLMVHDELGLDYLQSIRDELRALRLMLQHATEVDV